jgi:hypothetical protein
LRRISQLLPRAEPQELTESKRGHVDVIFTYRRTGWKVLAVLIDRLIESGSDGEFVELADDLLDRVTQDYPSAPATVVRRSK